MKKHTLIIGGTRGIGRALVKTLAKENRVLSVIGKRPPIEKDTQIPNIRYWIVDLLNQKLLAETLTEIISQNGKLSSVVFFQRDRGEGDDWKQEIETSLTATRNVIEHLADKFDDSDERSIVIVSSIAGHYIAEEQPLSYHVAKAGLNQMARFYAVALGPKQIRVNCVSFGTILKEESKDFYLQNRKLHNFYKRITPLGRMGTAEDIAGVIAFLCSPKASFITGQNIIVDGGISLRSHESLARHLALLKDAHTLCRTHRGSK